MLDYIHIGFMALVIFILLSFAMNCVLRVLNMPFGLIEL